MRLRIFVLAGLIADLLVGGVFPADNASLSESPLVSTDWLAEHLSDSSLVLLHVGMKLSYNKEHIPGARIISLRTIMVDREMEGITHEMPPMAVLDSVFESLGVSNDSRVVIYYVEAWGLSSAARILVTLDYLGMGERTSLLDGGLKQWKSEGRPVTADIPEFTTGNFTPQPHEDLIVQAAWIEENLRNPEVVIVDARPREHYDGQETGGGIARYGHIAGAVSIPVTDIMRDDPAYLFKERLALLEMFTAAGAKPGSQLIIYCNSGIWATSVYVTARYLGYDVRFYDGSFQDWCQVETRPIIEPAKKRFSLSGLLRKIFR